MKDGDADHKANSGCCKALPRAPASRSLARLNRDGYDVI
jgi:hypothetical protein